MPNQPTDAKTTYWALSVQPADGYRAGMSPTVYLCHSAQALDNLRTQLIKDENVNRTAGPNVYQIDRVHIPDELRRTKVDQEFEAAAKGEYGAKAKLDGIIKTAPTGFLSDNSWDVIVGKDYLHQEPSMWITKNPVIAVGSVMQYRNASLQPFQEAAERTNPYKQLEAKDLAHPMTQAAMQMAYAGVGIRHETLKPAIAAMAKYGLDTASMVIGFQQRYEEKLDEISAQNPGLGYHERQNEALMATAKEYRETKTHGDMQQQRVFQGIEGTCFAQREYCAQLDSMERDQAFTMATEAITYHLQRSGQYLSNAQMQNFRHNVMMAIGAKVNNEGFDPATPNANQAIVQGVIKDVARGMEKQARDAHDDRAGFSFASIAEHAEDISNDYAERGEPDSLNENEIAD